jgi:hypothetical protein
MLCGLLTSFRGFAGPGVYVCTAVLHVCYTVNATSHASCCCCPKLHCSEWQCECYTRLYVLSVTNSSCVACSTSNTAVSDAICMLCTCTSTLWMAWGTYFQQTGVTIFPQSHHQAMGGEGLAMLQYYSHHQAIQVLFANLTCLVLAGTSPGVCQQLHVGRVGCMYVCRERCCSSLMLCSVLHYSCTGGQPKLTCCWPTGRAANAYVATALLAVACIRRVMVGHEFLHVRCW